MKRAILLRTVCAATIVFACDEGPVSPPKTGSITLAIVTDEPMPAARNMPRPAVLSVAGHLDAARVRVSGPTSKSLDLTPGPSGFSGTVDGLTPGSYTVVVEGLVANEVDYFGQTSGVQVRAGQNSGATITNFDSFRSVLADLGPPTAGTAFTARWTRVANAQSYRVEWDKNPSFPSPSSKDTTDTLATIRVTDTGTYNVRVRAVNASVALGRASDSRSILMVPYPVPVLGSLSRDTATAGSSGFTLTATGSSFAPTAVVRWNGAERTTTFVSANVLQVAIPASDIDAVGTALVTVFNPGPGGGSSGALTFTILNQVGPARLAFTVQPGTTVAGQTIAPAVQVAIQDASGNTVTTATSTITVAIGTNPATGTLLGTTSVAAINGIATFSNLHIDNVGNGYTLTATSGTLTSATSTTFDIAPLVVVGRSPTPYVGAASFIARTSSFSATFSAAMAAATPSTFVVNSSQRGRWFLGGTYGGTGTTTLATPAASFYPGEEVEVVLTTGLAASGGTHLAAPLVTRYQVAAAAAPATFTPASGSPVAVGTNPYSATLGDVNGDGKLDLVTANYASNSVTVLLGNGDGTVAAASGSPMAVGASPIAVALGDVNGDGKLDLVTANSQSNNVTVLLGNGDGTFTAASGNPVAVGSVPGAVELGDLNGDGKLDLVTENEGSNNATVLLGDGDGTFTAAARSPVTVGTNPYSVALEDVNGDGKLDLVTANYGSNDATVLLGNGDGTFTTGSGSPVAVGSYPVLVALGDVNGDGKLDLATANWGSSTVTVLRGNGDGTFTAALGSPVTVGSGPYSVALGDVNGDGKLDLVTANVGSNNATVLLGSGDGTFTAAAGSPAAVGSGPNSVALEDVNGDGKLDLIVTNGFSNNVTILLNQAVLTAANPGSLVQPR